jgi:hypothetical protein
VTAEKKMLSTHLQQLIALGGVGLAAALELLHEP